MNKLNKKRSNNTSSSNNREYLGLLNSISDKVFNILKWNNYNLETKNSYYNSVKVDFQIILEKWIPWFVDLGILDNFTDNRWDICFNKIVDKIEKNIYVYLDVIIDVIKKKYWKEEINQKLIKKYLKKTFDIFLVLWDKIDLETFEKLLFNASLDDMKELKSRFLNNSYKLNKQEKIVSDTQLNDEHSYNDFISESHLSSAYRVWLRRGIVKYYEKEKENENEQDQNENQIIEKPLNLKEIDKLTSDEIFSELSVLFTNLYDLYTKTIDLWSYIDIRLGKLKKAFIKVISYMESFWDLWIIINKDKKRIILSDEDFSEKICDLFIKWFDKNDKIHNSFLEFLNDYSVWLTKTKNSIDDINKSKTDTSIWNEKIKLREFKLSKSSLDDWYNLDPYCATNIFFNRVLNWKKWKKINLKNFNLNLINKKLDLFANKLTNKWFKNSLESVSTQLSKIKNFIKEWINIEELIDNDVNHIQFLYELWIFNLELKRNPDMKIAPRSHNWESLGLSDFILKKIKDSGDKFDVDFNPRWRLHNMSEENVWSYIDSYFYSFSKWSIDLWKYTIWNKKLSKMKGLYSLDKDNVNYKDLDEFINLWIETWVWLLNPDFKLDSNKLHYIWLLQSYNIIWNNYEKLSTNCKNNLILIIEWLKVIHSKLKPLNNMLNVAWKDSKIVKDILWDFLNNEDDLKNDKSIADWMWPTKEFGRAFEKLISKYYWNFHELWDLTRLRVKANGIDEIMDKFVEFLSISWSTEDIKNIWLEDWTWHPLSLPKKGSWYRDLKAVFTLSSGNVVEVQFHYLDMIKSKTVWININKNIWEIIRREIKPLNKNELILFVKKIYSFRENSIHVWMLENISDLSYNEISNIDEIKWLWSNWGSELLSWDDTYKIIRSLDNEKLNQKLTRIERIIFDEALKKVIKKFLRKHSVIK